MSKKAIPFKVYAVILSIAVFLIVLQLHANTINIENYNCSDFDTIDEAQAIFKQNTTDVYGLDRDGDKIPCESLK